MNKKILAFGASNSKHSINRQLANFAASQVSHAEVSLLDLNEFELPIYSIDREKESGIPALALQFKELINQADGIVISFAEHNGNFTVAYKNIYDWISRIDRNIWRNKPMFLLATSPGRGGGKSVLELAKRGMKHSHPSTCSYFSLPGFRHNFSKEEGILDEELASEFDLQLQQFIQSLKHETKAKTTPIT